MPDYSDNHTKGFVMMLQQFPLTALATIAALFVYFYCTIRVGRARAQHGVKPPSVDGPDDFQRINRVHQNMLEQLIIHFPSLWLFAAAWGDFSAGIIGLVFAFGRILYAQGYYKAAEKRGRGFAISSLATIVLMIGAFIGVIMSFY